MGSFLFIPLMVLTLAACSATASPQPSSPIAPTSHSMWNLPTGSTIAYRRYAGSGASTGDSIIYLHGGPGAPVLSLPDTLAMLARLSETGRDVYAYDQVGGGASERLSDIREYTVARHVADLEAIRERIGAERLVLFGSSWGATLAAHYLAEHPDRVSALILSGPGVMAPADWRETGYGRVEDRMSAEDRARMEAFIEGTENLLLGLQRLGEGNVEEAVRIFPDQEAGALFDDVVNRFYLPYLSCPGVELDARSQGYGFWANRMTGRDLDAIASPAERLRDLDIPTLVLRGSCEYMDRAVAEQYRDVLDGRLVEIEDAGHIIWWEQPDRFHNEVAAFLER